MGYLRVLSLCYLLAGALFAQGDRGTITGTVSDLTQAVIPGAVVIATNVETGSQSRTTSTDTGNYTLSQLPAGRYNLEVESDGFNRFVQEGIRIFVAQTARIDVRLQVGATAESVTVTADAALLKTESAEQSSTISREKLDALPINFGARGNFAAANIRNPYMFAALVPGGGLSSYSSIKLNGAPLNSFQIRVEGQESNNNRLMIRIDQVQPSVESLEEISVQTSNFAPEYGQVSGGLFNLTAKSGTNQIHGSAFEYFVNEAMNAGLPYTNAGNGEHVKPRNRRHNFGGSFGGPVVIPKLYDGHNKTFFFFSLEIFSQKELVGGLLQTVPTDAMRAGDFSAALTGRSLATDPLGRSILENTIYDPLSTRVENGARVRDPFPNNFIPDGRRDSASLKVQSYIPRATRPGLINNWDQAYVADTQKNIATVKFDHNFGGSDKVSVYYSRYWGPHYNGSDGLPIPITRVRRFATRTNTIRVNYNRSISPTVLLNLGVGFLRHWNPDLALPEVLGFDAEKELGLSGLLRTGFPSIGSMFTGTGGGMQISMGSTGSIPATTKPTAVAAVSWVRNNHTYKFGGDWRIDGFTNRNVAGAIPSYTFNAQQTTLPSTQGQNLSGGAVGLPYASFLLGAVNTASISNPPDPQGRKPSLSLFAQDNWKMTRKLTLDYGLRWDHQGFPVEIHRRTSMFDPTIANPAAGGLLGATAYEGEGPGRCNCRFAETYNYAFGPRLGIAYQLNNKTVLRGGWGITYAATTGSQSTPPGTLGAGGWNTINFETPAFGESALLLRNGLQYNRADLFRADYNPGIRPSLGLIDTPPPLIDHNGGRPPRVMQWNISLQREITPNLVVEAAYVGNRGAWYPASSNANILVDLNALTGERLRSFGLDINSAADQQLLRSRLDSSLATSRGFGGLPYPSYSRANTVAQSLRPFPQFGNLTINSAPLAKTWYDSLQVKMTKRYSHGLDLLGTFTWQKELTTDVPTNNVFNRAAQKGLSSLSEPLILVIALNYRTPAVGSNRWISTLLRDWTVGAILRYASGLPIPVPRSQNQLSALLFQDTVMNRVAGEPLFLKDLNGDIDPNKDFALNPAAWADPVAGQFGVSAPYYDDYRFARRPDEQISFGRIFQIKEKVTFSVRAEFFNAFNRISMNNPSATNPLQTPRTNPQGVPIAGFGRIDSGSLYGPPRNGQIVARIQF